METVTIPENVTEIGHYTFSGCNSLKTATVSESVTSIGNHAFSDCTKLETATLLCNISRIPEYIFAGCAALKEINIPESVQRIDNYAFQNCIALEKVTLPKNLDVLEDYVFTGCLALKDVVFADYSIKEIKTQTFKECQSLVSLVLPKGLTKIGSQAFMHCTKLTDITIPESVTSIDETAFSYPEKLTIHGKPGSYAETFAKENEIAFNDNSIPVTGIILKGGEETVILDQGETYRAEFEIFPEDGNEVVTLTTDNGCVSINGHEIYAQYDGDAVITASTSSGLRYTFNVHIRSARNIAVTTKPAKTIYVLDEEFDPAGMVVQVNYNDGTSKTVEDYTVTGFDSSVEGANTVTVQWKAANGSTYSAKFTVEIVDLRPKLTGIFVDTLPAKTVYELRENLDLTGLVVKGTYTDETNREVTGYTVSGFNALKAGPQIITVTCEDFTTTFAVLVGTVRAVDAVTVAQLPTKTVYWTGEDMDAAGLTLTAIYNDGSTETVTEGFTVTGFDSAAAGEKTVTVTYEGKTATFTVTVNAPTVTGIAVTAQPNKTQYWVGEALNTDGLTLTATYSDGSTKTVTAGFTTSGFSNSVAGEKTVTVTYEGKTTTFTVTVEPPVITAIAIRTQPNKTQYWVGEELNTAGLTLTVTYSNGSRTTVTGGFEVYGFTSTTAGKKVVAVAYQGKTASFTVTVSAPTITGMTINTQPNKTQYWVGESLDTTGLTLTTTLSDGSTATVTNGFTVFNFDSTTAGEKTLTVMFGGFTDTFTVTVKEQTVGENDPQILVESKQVTKGSVFTVTVQIKNNPGFSYLEVTPVIAPELTLVDVANGQLIADFTKGYQYVWVADGDVADDGLLMTFTFAVTDSVKPGSYQVGFLVRTCGNYAEESVSLCVAAADIAVIDHMYGDATGDGVVDGFDVIRLKKYLANYNYETGTSNVAISAGADATGDGVVDGFDVIRLKKYLANYNYETGESTTPLGPQHL